MDPIRRVLVTKLRHHGDVLLSSPVIGALKRHFPAAEIGALVYHDTRDMLAGHPGLTRLHTIPRKAGLGDNWRLLRELHGVGYDALIHLTNSSRGALLARILRPRIAVGPAGNGKFYRASFTHLYKNVFRNSRHTVENNLDALRRIGLNITEEDKRLTLIPGEAADARADAYLAEFGLTAKNFILIHPTSRWLFKCWPEAKVADLADRLIRLGHPVLFTSAPDAQETEMLGRIQALMQHPAASLAGKLTLKELAALIARARLFIGVDSAPMHMAAAVATPTVALFGPSGEIDWGPWRVESRVITSNHTCRPCGLDGCGGSKKSECLEVIEVEEVLQAAEALL